MTKILTCHVVAKTVLLRALNKMIKDDGGAHPVKTVGGCVFTAYRKDGKTYLKDSKGTIARITQANVVQSNGVIHVINRVLLPK